MGSSLGFSSVSIARFWDFYYDLFFLLFFAFSKIVFVVFHLNFCSFPHAVVASVNSSPRKLLFQDNFVSRGQIKSSSFIGPCIHMQPMLAGPCSL